MLLSREGITEEDILDRRKDLFHNALGRKIANEVKQKGLSTTEQAYHLMTQRILEEVETGEAFIPHYADPRVKSFKSEAEMGCPGLPHLFSLYKH